jgi:hypothetical protein
MASAASTRDFPSFSSASHLLAKNRLLFIRLRRVRGAPALDADSHVFVPYIVGLANRRFSASIAFPNFFQSPCCIAF